MVTLQVVPSQQASADQHEHALPSGDPSQNSLSCAPREISITNQRTIPHPRRVTNVRKMMWAAMVLILPAANIFYWEHSKQKLTAIQIELQRGTLAAAKEANELRVWEVMWPKIEVASGTRRQELLELSAMLAPRTFEKLSPHDSKGRVLLQTSTFEKLHRESVTRAAEQDLLADLFIARQYARYRLAGQASRNFHELAGKMSGLHQGAIDYRSLATAEDDFSRGEFDVALSAYERAFERIH
jgi:hypothetical protein